MSSPQAAWILGLEKKVRKMAGIEFSCQLSLVEAVAAKIRRDPSDIVKQAAARWTYGGAHRGAANTWHTESGPESDT